MLAIWGAALMVGAIAACVSPLFYYRDSDQDHGNESLERSETIESESPLVHIKISRPQRDQFSDDASTTDACDSRRNSVDSADIKEMKPLVLRTEPVYTKEGQLVLVKSPCNRPRIESGIWSSAFKNQLQNITNSSSEMCASTRVVAAQVEANPTVSESSNRDTVSSLGGKSVEMRVEKARRVSSVIRRWRNIKKTLICSRSDKSALFKDHEHDETQRLIIPGTVPDHRSPVGHSTILQKNRLIDASTSTNINCNLPDVKTQKDEATKHYNISKDYETTSKRSESEYFCSNTEKFQEMVSLVKRQSVNGKSICDIRITGLTINQPELLELFEASRNETKTASVITTEEESIISIKFDRRRNSSEGDHRKDSYTYKSPLERFYKSLPERMEDLFLFRLFRSQEQSEKSGHTAPSIQISDRSSNETSYRGFSNVRNRIAANESAFFERKTSLRRRISNNRAPRYDGERQI